MRLRRLTNLLTAAGTKGEARIEDLPLGSNLNDILAQIEQLVPEIKIAVRETIDRAKERGAFPLELLDLHTWRLGTLRAAFNLSPRVDRSLMRYILRLASLLVPSVLVHTWLGIPHGYWLGLTLIVVMQPDYGSTRQRARPSAWRHTPGKCAGERAIVSRVAALRASRRCGVNSFLFALFLKRRYDVAAVFLTIMVVLLTEMGGPVDWRLTLERVVCTLAGGGLALVAAHFFWPSWEKDRFQPLMSEALLASCGYIKLLCRRLREGTGRGRS